jgi:probable rRNA maturation factor
MIVLNQQRSARVGQRALEAFARHVAEAVRLDPTDFAVCLVGDRRIRVLNRRFRGKDRPTDVLSFPSAKEEVPWKSPVTDPTPRLGEIVISVPAALRQAREEGHSLREEIRLLVIHGVLHLMGYDHETDGGEMKRREYALRRRLL